MFWSRNMIFFIIIVQKLRFIIQNSVHLCEKE